MHKTIAFFCKAKVTKIDCPIADFPKIANFKEKIKHKIAL